MIDLRLPDRVPSGRIGIEPVILGDGWFVAERAGRWAVGDRSTLKVDVSDPRGLHLYIES